MLDKKITAKVNRVLKIGSLEEEQAKELKTLETLFPEETAEIKVETEVEEQQEQKAEDESSKADSK